MQYRYTIVTLFAAVVAAQNSTSLAGLVSQLPTCALNCFSTSAQTAGCSTTDFECLCGDGRSKFISAIAPCIFTSSCSSDDTNKVTTLAGQICVVESENPSPTDVASASNIITSALGTATGSSTSSTSTPNAAATQGAAIGLVGVGAFAALLL